MKVKILSEIRATLTKQVDEKYRDGAQRYFKEAVKVYGVRNNIVGRIARQYFSEIKNLPKEEIFNLCAELLKSNYNEDAYIAFEWSYYLRNKYAPDDLITFEHWLNEYVNTWAKCDTLCNHTIGSFIESYPVYISKLKQWAVANNLWLRRAAAVTLIIPAKQGKFLDDIFKIADLLLTDKEDLVQKGYGWMLKEASRQHQEEVFEYVMQHKTVMPRTALRYAIEKMPDDLRHLAMVKE